MLYLKVTNVLNAANSTGPNMISADKAFIVKHWNPSFIGLLKWNTDASPQMQHQLPMCVWNTGRIRQFMGRRLEIVQF